MDLVYALVTLLRAGFTLSVEPTLAGDLKVAATDFGSEYVPAIEQAVQLAAQEGLDPTVTHGREGTYYWSVKAAADR